MAPTEQQAKQLKVLQLAGKKTPKARVQRYLKSTGPKLKETGKSCLLLKGIKCSANMMILLKELRTMQAPNAKLLSKNNSISIFNDITGQQSLEFLMIKNDTSLFAMASHNKKRPNNLIIGRTFDHHILDIVELGVLYLKSMNDYGGTVPKKRIGSKPLLLFQGDIWQQNNDYKNLQNLLTDFYRGDVVDKLIVTGIDHIIVFTVSNDNTNNTNTIRVHQRTYFIKLKKNDNNSNNNNTPAAHLTPCGPDIDMILRRTTWADPELYHAARKQPAQSKKTGSTKKKNQKTNLFGETLGRLHMSKQNLDNGQGIGRKSKALRRAEKAEAEEERAAIEKELNQEKDTIDQEFQRDYGYSKSSDNKEKK